MSIIRVGEHATSYWLLWSNWGWRAVTVDYVSGTRVRFLFPHSGDHWPTSKGCWRTRGQADHWTRPRNPGLNGRDKPTRREAKEAAK